MFFFCGIGQINVEDSHKQKDQILSKIRILEFTVKGVFIDSIPNKSFTNRTLKGIEQTYAWDEI